MARVLPGQTIVLVDRRSDYGKNRVRAIGQTDVRVFVVIYTDRGPVRWITSAWKASGKDLKLWQDYL